jgi:alkylated DNA repair protein (DNA oxidative demethylase)
VQSSLFGDADLPEGFRYEPHFLTEQDERELLLAIADVDVSGVEMRGGVARRRTAHYGWTYGYDARTSEPGEPIPAWLLPVRARAATWAGLEAEALAEALVTEYPEGAPIGWHRDAPMFGDVIGISLAGPCRMKFRPYVSPKDLGGTGRQVRRTTHELKLAPRSVYLMRGVVRRDFEHSIPPVGTLRYSITFRTMRT